MEAFEGDVFADAFLGLCDECMEFFSHEESVFCAGSQAEHVVDVDPFVVD